MSDVLVSLVMMLLMFFLASVALGRASAQRNGPLGGISKAPLSTATNLLRTSIEGSHATVSEITDQDGITGLE